VVRRLLLFGLLAFALLLTVNTIVTDNQTKPAKADIGRILSLPDGDLQVREDGPRDKPAIVMLHGFAASMHWWTPMAERLRTQFRLIRIDLLGHGGSEKPDGGYSMEHQARQVALALSSLGIRHAVIAGHSLGGAVATALAELKPSLIDGLILVDTAPNKDAAHLPFLARLGFVPVIGEAIRRVVTDGQVRDSLGKAFASGFKVPDQFVKDFRRMTYSSYDSSHSAFNDYEESHPVSTRLTAVGKPLLVIFGGEDELVDPKSARDYTRASANVVIVPGAGHTPIVEKPDEIKPLISHFVTNITRGPADKPPRTRKTEEQPRG
jgi:pimeloyl-ACP methyl ester carboxylesterase